MPATTEEARSLLQARVGQFGRIGMLVGLCFLAIAVLLHVVLPMPGSRAIVLAQVVALSIGAVVWLGTRRGRLSIRTLLVVDATSTLAICSVFLAMTWALGIWTRPDLVAILCVTDILVLRAFLVPSSTLRTAVIGSSVALMVSVSTGVRYHGVHLHPQAPSALGYLVVAAIFMFATVLVTSLTSRTIFGLRERVREAARLGQYTLVEKIGEGGMGIVYRASHAMLRRPTAIKLLPAERAGEDSVARFEREVQLTSLLTHPNTVAIYDYGRTADGVFYYAMEYLDGIDLEQLVELDGPQPPGRVVTLLRQLCGALEEAHGVGLIHRDIKPANVLLCERSGAPDVIKVLDFGLVKSLGEEPKVGVSAADQIIGTPLYLSPEAIQSPNAVDARSDLYAVGALGYFLLVGEPPFTGRSVVEVCGHHLHSSPKAPHERSADIHAPRLEALLLACLQKSPAERPQTAGDILRALAECVDTPPWSDREARAWWQQQKPALAAKRSRLGQDRSGVRRDQTIAIDFAVRDTAVERKR